MQATLTSQVPLPVFPSFLSHHLLIAAFKITNNQSFRAYVLYVFLHFRFYFSQPITAAMELFAALQRTKQILNGALDALKALRRAAVGWYRRT